MPGLEIKTEVKTESHEEGEKMSDNQPQTQTIELELA